VGHVPVTLRVTDRGRRYDYPYQLISSVESFPVKDNSNQYKHRAPIHASAVPRGLHCLINFLKFYSIITTKTYQNSGFEGNRLVLDVDSSKKQKLLP
jgi:hypothetical protein